MRKLIRGKDSNDLPPKETGDAPAGEAEPEADGKKTQILIPSLVFRGLEAVRLSGLTNMLDRPMVALLADRLGYPDAARWIKEHPKLFAEGLFHGFCVNPEEENA